MKNKIKSILGNGLPWGMASFALAFITGYAFKIGLHNNIQISTLVAIIGLLLNGLVYSRFSKSPEQLEGISIKLEDSEPVALQAPANYLIDGSLVPGKLFLTDKRILFKPFKPKEDILQEYTWYLTQLVPLAFYKSIWNAGGEFLLKTNNEITLMFEVDKLKPWKEALRRNNVL
jgi:hypothetical protein